MELSQELQARLRQAIPDYDSRNRFQVAARRKAIEQLAVKHPDEANELYNERVRARIEAIEEGIKHAG